MKITKTKPIRLRIRFEIDGIYQIKSTVTDLGVNISQDDLDALHLDDEQRAELVKLLRNEIQTIYKSYGK